MIITGKRGYALVGYWPHQLPDKLSDVGDFCLYQSTFDPEKCVLLYRKDIPLDMYYNVERQEYELRRRFSFKLVAVGTTPEQAIRAYKAAQRVKGVAL